MDVAELSASTRARVLNIDYYNFQRTHSGIGGLVPADRFFGAAPDVLRTLQERVAANACELARQVAALEQEQKDLKIALRAAEVRAEIAQSMPHLLSRKGRSEKKRRTTRRRKGS